MSLITRCPVCETMFKVVADQFKVAQGWVRCGYCGEVFDAAQHLVSEENGVMTGAAPDGARTQETPQGEQDTPVSLPATASGELQQELVSALPEAVLTVPEAQNPAISSKESGESGLAKLDGEPALHSQPAPAPAPAPEIEFFYSDAAQVEIPPVQHFPVQDFSVQDLQVQASSAQASPAQDLPEEEASVNQLPETALPASAAPVGDAPAELSLSTADQPVSPAPDEPVVSAVAPAPEVSFVRDARRKAFWKRPLVRGFLGLLSLALLAALLLQWVLQHKDTLAARDPRLAPFLQALCGPLNCEIRPPRRIESLVIDSSSFSKTGPDLYRLSFVLKNTSAAVLEIPALEVTLTDGQEQALVRRVLAPREFGATAARLAAHAELAGVVTLKVSGEPVEAPAASRPLPVTGYRILAFYP